MSTPSGKSGHLASSALDSEKLSHPMFTMLQICPSMLVKKDRGRPTDPKTRPQVFGEVNIAGDVPGIELFRDTDEDSDIDEVDGEDDSIKGCSEPVDFDFGASDDDENSEDDNVNDNKEEIEDVLCEGKLAAKSVKKRKCLDFDGQLIGSETSLSAPKRLAGMKDGILSNDDFKQIEEQKAKKEAKMALSKHGLIGKGASVQLSMKRVDPMKLEVHVKRKLNKEERLAHVRAGREDRGKYQARAAVKKKKTGGLSNRQKERKKFMPIAAKRAKATRSLQEKRKKQNRAGKQFRGRKAWK